MTDCEPLLIRHQEAQRLIALAPSKYWALVRSGTIETVGRGAMSRAVYASIKAYVQALVAEAEAKAGRAA